MLYADKSSEDEKPSSEATVVKKQNKNTTVEGS
jgi:hypothetical protein